jgi:hypothetical protein
MGTGQTAKSYTKRGSIGGERFFSNFVLSLSDVHIMYSRFFVFLRKRNDPLLKNQLAQFVYWKNNT